jgi:hypothetical protein
MHRELVVKAFEKAKIEMEESGVSNPATTKLAKYLIDKIDEEVNFIYGDRSLRNYYSKILKDKEEDINIPQVEVVNGLCQFLGYSNYHDFILKEGPINNYSGEKIIVTKKGTGFIFRDYKVILLILAIVVISILIISGMLSNDQKWMIWEGDHYVETQFDEGSYSEGSLEILDGKALVSFRQILPDCSTEFFKSNGSPKIWYGKNRGMEYEFFTSLGYHPETRDQLKPITEYMIRKYICFSFK